MGQTRTQSLGHAWANQGTGQKKARKRIALANFGKNSYNDSDYDNNINNGKI